MNKLEVGMYVRTTLGITKYLGKYENSEMLLFDKLDLELWSGDLADVLYRSDVENVILKSSYNIIDLLEEGDYVNGEMVMEADWNNDNDEYEEGLAFPLYDGEDKDVIVNWLPLKYTKIKSIVTKEQFESIKYEVE